MKDHVTRLKSYVTCFPFHVSRWGSRHVNSSSLARGATEYCSGNGERVTGNVELGSGNGRRETGNVFSRLALLLALVLVSMAATDSGTRFNKLGHELMCTCGCGQVLLECNHVGCGSSDGMRAELMAAMQRGGSDSDVLNWFVQKYGAVVLAAPTKTGFNLVAWIMPTLVLVLGLTLTIVLVRVWKSRIRPVPVTQGTIGGSKELEALRQRVHQETDL